MFKIFATKFMFNTFYKQLLYFLYINDFISHEYLVNSITNKIHTHTYLKKLKNEIEWFKILNTINHYGKIKFKKNII